jgi:hypothetical protein
MSHLLSTNANILLSWGQHLSLQQAFYPPGGVILPFHPHLICPSLGDISVISQMQFVMQQDDLLGLRLPPSRSAVPFDQLKNVRGTLMKKVSLHWSTFSLQMSVLQTHTWSFDEMDCERPG